MAKPTRSGRRPGNPDTRDTILVEARKLFAGQGFQATSIRAVAAAAGVDPALVHHYFASKDQLFLATVQIPVDVRAVVGGVVAGDPERVGANLVATLVRVWDSPAGTALAAAFRAALADPGTSRMVMEFVSSALLGTVATAMHLAPDEAPRRTGLIASQLVGIIVGRYLLALEPLAAMTGEELAEAIGPTIQRYLTGPIASTDPGATAIR